MCACLASLVYGQNYFPIRVVEESSLSEEKDPVWWVNSGAYFCQLYDVVGYTILGPLPEENSWRKLYAKNNPRDTDDGYYPQNIFRLVTRKKYENFSQGMYFFIVRTNMSESENRNESNGVLFFNRYKDGDNLYYAGIRVDGRVVIKKKVKGTYYMLSYPKAAYPGVYDRTSNPNLLPEKKWIGMRSIIKTVGETVLIQFYVDLEVSGTWTLAAEIIDDGTIGGPPIFEEGYAGIRTDFMDMIFVGYTTADEE